MTHRAVTFFVTLWIPNTTAATRHPEILDEGSGSSRGFLVARHQHIGSP